MAVFLLGPIVDHVLFFGTLPLRRARGSGRVPRQSGVTAMWRKRSSENSRLAESADTIVAPKGEAGAQRGANGSRRPDIPQSGAGPQHSSFIQD